MNNNIFAPLLVDIGENTTDSTVGWFITRYLLFDHYTIDSRLMKELVVLVEVFGIEGLNDLLNSGNLSIHMSAYTTGQMNYRFKNEENPRPSYMKNYQQVILPYGHFAPTIVDIPNREEYVSYGFRNINNMGYPPKRTKALKETIQNQLTQVPDTYDDISWMKNALLSDSPIAGQAIANNLGNRKNPIDISDIKFHFEYLDEDVIKVETNLTQLTKMSEFEAHKIVEKSILNVGGFYRRMSLMKEYDSIAWFGDQDSKLMTLEVERIAININSKAQEDRLTRVIELAGLPKLIDIKTLNAHTLINLRNSRECIEFREWLKTSDAKTDQDIKDEIKSYTTAFKNMLGKFQIKLARFALTTSVGAATSLNPLVGVAVGAADQFLVDRLIKRNSPIWFINNELPKLYDPYKQ